MVAALDRCFDHEWPIAYDMDVKLHEARTRLACLRCKLTQEPQVIRELICTILVRDSCQKHLE